MITKNEIDAKPVLLVLASTYPRWNGDHEPGFVHELAKRLTDQFKVIALVPSAPGAAAFETLDGVLVIRYRYAPRRFETLVNDGGIVTNLRRYRWKMLLLPSFVLSQAWHTRHLLRTHRVDVLHAHWLLPQGLIAAFFVKLLHSSPKYLVTSHGADLFALQGNGLNSLKRFVVKKSAAVTVVSEAMRKEMEMLGADISKVRVEPMGVDMASLFTPNEKVQRSCDEILFVGRFVEKKGLRYLIDAMPAVLRANPSAFLTVVGFGPEEGERQAQVQILGLQSKVQFVGAMPQQKLPALYQRAAMFVAPFISTPSGDQEGLGLVAVEAASCSCPVIVSDLPAIRDVFDETTARLVPPGSTSALSDAISGVFANRPALSLLETVRQSIRNRFDWSVVAGHYAQILQNVIDK